MKKINWKQLKKHTDLAIEVASDSELAWEIYEAPRGSQSKSKEFMADTIDIIYKEYCHEDMEYTCEWLAQAVVAIFNGSEEEGDFA
jgi:hypothetical protein